MIGMEDDLDREDDLSDLERQPDDYYEDEELFLQEPTDDDLDQRDWDYEPTPEELWAAYLTWENESDRIQQLVDALIARGCKKGELLQALLRLRNAYAYPLSQRSDLVKRTEHLEKASRFLPDSLGDKFGLEDWVQLQKLLERYVEHLKIEAEACCVTRPGHAAKH